MKKMKKVFAFMLALAMMLSLTGIVNAGKASAEETTRTITIQGAKTDPKHSFSAYQVFKGNLSDGKLVDVDWGDGINKTKILSALKTADNATYESCETAQDVVDILVTFGDKSDKLYAFADVVAANLAEEASGTSELAEGATNYTISVQGDGYYFIKDTTDLSGKHDAITRYLLKVFKDETVTVKSEIPSIDKVIVNADSNDGNADGNGTAVNVGEEVTFKLTSKVPDMDGYTTYEYIVNDTLSAGLSFVNDSVGVKIGGTDYTGFKVSDVTDGQFSITFNDFIDQKAQKNADIVITYKATLNQNALTTDKETNTVSLSYSNDPKDISKKGKTPDKTVYVYDFDIVIDKYTTTTNPVTGKAEKTKLKNAEFILYKEVADSKLYYKWDGSSNTVSWVDEKNQATSVITDTNGAAKFTGLDAGEYKLEEIAQPDGYNLLTAPVEVSITATYNNDGTISASSAQSIDENKQYSQTQSVENKAGSTLPSTGGIGTTIFYVLGGILMAAAVVLLITKKKMSAYRN